MTKDNAKNAKINRKALTILFSVAMCVYEKDSPEHFKTAVDSILNQTVKPSEVVLVVDGPVSGALDQVIKKFEENDLFVVKRLPVNQGHGNARRVGIGLCKNELVAIMDADDISLPDRFRSELDVFSKNSKLDVVGGDISEFIDSADHVVGYRKVPVEDVQLKDFIKERCPFNQVTVMFKKSSYERAGGYLDWYCDEDYYLWLRMMQSGCRFANTGTVTVNVRVGNDMYQRRGGWKYYKSEAALQKYMLNNHIIGTRKYLINIGKRFLVQVVLPKNLRGWVYNTFAREHIHSH